MRAKGIDPKSLKDYIEGFRLAPPSHADAGSDEKESLCLSYLWNIRLVGLFPENAKNIPAPLLVLKLRRVRDSTMNPPPKEFGPEEQ